MEVLTAARRYLLGWEPATSLAQQRVFKERLGVKVDGTGLSAVVLTLGAGWASPDRVQSVEFPRLIVDCIADPQRDELGGIVTFPRLRGEWIGGFGSRRGLLVISSQVWSEARAIEATDYHTIVEEQEAGDTVKVRTEYALEVAHVG